MGRWQCRARCAHFGRGRQRPGRAFAWNRVHGAAVHPALISKRTGCSGSLSWISWLASIGMLRIFELDFMAREHRVAQRPALLQTFDIREREIERVRFRQHAHFLFFAIRLDAEYGNRAVAVSTRKFEFAQEVRPGCGEIADGDVRILLGAQCRLVRLRGLRLGAQRRDPPLEAGAPRGNASVVDQHERRNGETRAEYRQSAPGRPLVAAREVEFNQPARHAYNLLSTDRPSSCGSPASGSSSHSIPTSSALASWRSHAGASTKTRPFQESRAASRPKVRNRCNSTDQSDPMRAE